MSSGSACWILWLTPMDWLALSIGRSGSQPLEYSFSHLSIFQVHIDNKQIRKQITSTNILMFKQNETIK